MVHPHYGIRVIALKPELKDTYMAVGHRSYCEHYTHLWANGDPAPYLESSFVPGVLDIEIRDPKMAHFIIYNGVEPVGILKLIKDQAIESYPEKDALLLEKLYLLGKSVGLGIGSQALDFVEKYAAELGKKVVWLDTMQEGPALGFYLNQGYTIIAESLLHFSEVLNEKRPMYILLKKLE